MAAADTFANVHYEAGKDPLVVTMLCRGTNPDHTFSLPWGDLPDKPLAAGGMNLSRLYASLVLLAFIAACIYFIPQRPARAGDPTA